ncbi:MAG: hypothetical protein JNK05_12070 [Myxococcales bacterium]|nr:hypothetical protein [Myxococcales bacterium]
MRTTLRSIALCLSLVSSQCAPVAAHETTLDAGLDGASVDSAPADHIAAPLVAPLEHGALLHEDRSWLVLDATLDQPGSGALTALTGSEFHQVATRTLTDEARARVPSTRRVRVFKGSQWVCDAELGAPVALAVAERGWDEEGRVRDRPIDEVWDSGLRSIAAPLTAIRGSCSEGTWARDASLPSPRFATSEAAPEALAQLAYEAIRTSPEARDPAEQFRSACEGAECGRPWDLRAGIERTATLFRASDGRQWLFAFVRDTEGCGGLGANIALLAEVTSTARGPALERVTRTTSMIDAPDALVEGDSFSTHRAWPELRTTTDRVVFTETGEWNIRHTIVPVYGCGC